MTPTDQKILIENLGIPPEKIFLAPNGISGNFPYGGINKKENVLIFLGNMYYQPNQKGIKYLINKVMPIVNKEISNVTLKAIGMVPLKLKKQYAKNKNVVFTGEIKDEMEFNRALASGTVGLCTVFAGSGMKVKILNYAASGLPIITTPFGFSGYEPIKSLIVVKPNAKDIAKEIIKLLKNKKEAEVIGRLNRQNILKEFSWNKITTKVIQAYQLADSLKNSSVKTVVNVPRPFWFREKRDVKRVLNKHFIINKNKIYEAS